MTNSSKLWSTLAIFTLPKKNQCQLKLPTEFCPLIARSCLNIAPTSRCFVTSADARLKGGSPKGGWMGREHHVRFHACVWQQWLFSRRRCCWLYKASLESGAEVHHEELLLPSRRSYEALFGREKPKITAEGKGAERCYGYARSRCLLKMLTPNKNDNI